MYINMENSVVMVALTAVFLPLVWSQDYCAISREHTMCKYQGTGPACNGEVLRRGVTKQEMEEILDAHNMLRAKIARGEEKRGKPGPQPPAANMRKMEWDDELASVAQRHADQCKFAHDCSDCRRVDRFGVGQNLYIYKQSLRIPDNNWRKAVTDWYDEVSLFSNKKVEPFQFGSDIGHYSQLVWADTDKVGCGATSYKDGRWFATLYTCNYGPNGNFIRGQMYKKGRACSDCPRNTSCSKQFPGLCESGNSDSDRTPQFTPGLPTTNRFTPETTTVRQTTRRPVIRTTTRRTTTTTSRRPTTTTTRRTTTLRPVQNSTMFECNFEKETKDCKIRGGGVKWSKQENFFSGVKNYYYGTTLESGEKTEMFFERLIEAPAGGIVCLDFKYKKYATGCSEEEGKSVPMNVLAWPYNGRPGKVSILRDSPDLSTWIRAQVTFRNIENFFLMMVKSEGPNKGQLHLAIDDITVTQGVCSN